MTTERDSTMTLEQVSAKLRRIAAEGRLSDRYAQVLRSSAIKMADAIDAHLATRADSGEAVAFALQQSFVDRVTSDGAWAPDVMGAGCHDSIKRIAEEMVTACKALLQGDAEITHDALDDWAHRIMCFANFTHPSATSLDVRDAVQRNLLAAAQAYYTRYCVDEADEDGPHWTGCSEQQSIDARELRDAISVAIASREGES